jgi:hypothetical protein
MTLTSTLGSPGIEIREIDNSVRINSNTSTTVFVPGFASQGPVDEVMSIGTIADFETIYGVPTNAAERYFYYTVKALVDGSGAGTHILCSRLPYGKDAGDTVSNAYTMLAYPAIPVTKTDNNIDFDQFVLGTDDKTKLEKFLSVKTTVSTVSEEGEENEGEGENGTPEPSSSNCSIKEFVLTLDDNHLASNESLTITAIASDSIIPKIGANYYNEDGTENTNIKAPIITIGDITANGHIAYEKPSNEKTVHFSYTLMKGDTQVGSLYIKVVYDDTVGDIDGMTIIGGTNCGVTVSFKEAFKIADAYNTSDEEITYIIGSPVTYQVSLQQYYKIITGETLKWSNDYYDFTDSETVPESDKFTHFDALGHAAFIVINTSRSIINSNFEGFYLGITDNTFGSPSEDMPYNAIESIKITTETYDEKEDNKIGLYDSIQGTQNFQSISSNLLSFPLNTKTSGSISHVLTRNITSMDITGSDYDDTINMALFKLSKSADNSDILKLNYSIREKYNWSFDKSRLKSVSGSSRPVSAFAENVVENSNNLTVLMNPYISGKTFVDLDGDMKGKIRVFGSKLLSNLEHYEKKYLCNNTSNSVEPTTTATRKNVSAMAIATMARSSINSWASLVKQAGVTPKFIKKHFTNYKIDVKSPNEEYKMFHPLNSLMPFGTYTKQGATNKLISNLPAKLERALELVENDEQYPDIDLILEGGLGTIYTYSKSSLIGSEGTGGFSLLSESGDPITDEMNTKGLFNENYLVQGVEDLRTSRTSLSDEANDFVDDYRAVQNVFVQFANSMQNGGRGDTFYISDVPRGVLIKGKNTKICNLYGSTLENNAYDFGETVNHSFPTSVYYPIKHLFDTIVSSYMSTYAQWVKILDNFSSEKVWIPISGYIAANMAATDGTYGPWYAAAGLRRGVINGTLDYALSPTISQRTDLYKICINSVPKIPNYGVTIWGIRTMGKKDSAFDQNTCRRTFLYMEKKIKQLMRYYIFEPNTSYTRLQIYNDIYPFLEKIKNAGGIYNYTLVCDTTNNTPDIINNGDLAVSIAAAPTRTAENIIVEFIANKYTEEVSSAESIQ